MMMTHSSGACFHILVHRLDMNFTKFFIVLFPFLAHLSKAQDELL